MKVSVVTLFPEIFGALDFGVLGKAIAAGRLELACINPRDFTDDVHRTVDDTPYGGGPGMVMKPDPLVNAIESAGPGHRILMSPAGRPLNQARVVELAALEHVVVVCGRYEGIDQRVCDLAIDEEISVGDFVVTGGELPAMALIDAAARYVPGVLGDRDSLREESFGDGLLEYPHYTRPGVFRGRGVPEVLQSGHHSKIANWRKDQSLLRTAQRRPDLLNVRTDRELADRIHVVLAHYPVWDRAGEVVTSSITNLDVHDIARTCATYGVASCTFVTPIEVQQQKIREMVEVWRRGPGDTRGPALARTQVADSIESAVSLIHHAEGQKPRVVITSAREVAGYSAIRFADARNTFRGDEAPIVLVFGTGWGLVTDRISSIDDVLEPISTDTNFNHLSVRSAAAIILDRLVAARP